MSAVPEAVIMPLAVVIFDAFQVLKLCCILAANQGRLHLFAVCCRASMTGASCSGRTLMTQPWWLPVHPQVCIRAFAFMLTLGSASCLLPQAACPCQELLIHCAQQIILLIRYHSIMTMVAAIFNLGLRQHKIALISISVAHFGIKALPKTESAASH